MDHTLQVYQVSLDQSFEAVQTQFDIRNQYLSVIILKPGLKSLEETKLSRLLTKQGNESNLNKNLLVNIEISDYLDQQFERILFSKAERKRLVMYDDAIDRALFAYAVQATALNQKLSEVPYRLYRALRAPIFGWSYQQAQLVTVNDDQGMIVER